VLLSELRNQAPGTYHHSIAVGNLASVAAEAISADPLLTRVGGYYHDVGKLSNPTFFMENLPSGDNPHVGLTPQQSIEIIKGHVTHGVEIAKRSRLPESIIKFIREHHGTTMLEFFYYKSMKDDLSRGLPESLFRYVGDKPSGPESALIMIADSVEAISRVVPSMTEEKARAIIEEVIRNKLLDGQFDNVELTAADFRRITEVMVKAIIGTAHQRKGYPELQRSRA